MAYGTVNADVIGTSVANTSLGAGNSSMVKNRITNGAMVVDQRNNGASVTVVSNNTYCVDRFGGISSQASKYSMQQNAGAVTPPVGFANYLGITSLSAYSVISTDSFSIRQAIEGYNISDLNWGSASAKPVVLSFWAYSSLTGTFGGSLRNNGGARSYPFSYSIPVANTWTKISISVPGDTSGTWLTTNGIGMLLSIGLGAGSAGSGTAGAWVSANYISTTGAVSVVGTSGATFYITGVQLEVGEQATGYEYRLYQQELALCQRYYYKVMPLVGSSYFGIGQVASGGTSTAVVVPFPVTMRTNPTALEQSGTATDYRITQASTALVNCSAVPTFINTTSQWAGAVAFTASTLGGTAGQASLAAANTSLTGYLAWSAEL